MRLRQLWPLNLQRPFNWLDVFHKHRGRFGVRKRSSEDNETNSDLFESKQFRSGHPHLLAGNGCQSSDEFNRLERNIKKETKLPVKTYCR